MYGNAMLANVSCGNLPRRCDLIEYAEWSGSHFISAVQYNFAPAQYLKPWAMRQGNIWLFTLALVSGRISLELPTNHDFIYIGSQHHTPFCLIRIVETYRRLLMQAEGFSAAAAEASEAIHLILAYQASEMRRHQYHRAFDHVVMIGLPA